jgi:tripartite-type tricarboxylate transporter receptor subunit TctC
VTALAISSKTRSQFLPDVPTIGEAGFAAAECNVWLGLLAPAKTPKEMVASLNEEVHNIAELRTAKEKLVTACAEPFTMPSAQFEKLIQTDYAVLDRLMRNAS